jgi:hypothetical protein
MLAGQDLPSKEKTCRLQVSWRVNFLHSTMMKGVIESGARNGIRDTYVVYKAVSAFHMLYLFATLMLVLFSSSVRIESMRGLFLKIPKEEL